jgi:hypothetical protein
MRGASKGGRGEDAGRPFGALGLTLAGAAEFDKLHGYVKQPLEVFTPFDNL